MVPTMAGLALLALLVLWLVLHVRWTPKEPERHSASYREQQTENPAYYPGHGGGEGGV